MIQAAQFEIVLKGDVLEPGASVAPRGAVTFVIQNDSESPHDLAVVQFASDVTPRDTPFRPGEEGVVGLVDAVAPGDARTATFVLEAGKYLVISNTPGPGRVGRSIFELTVQPAE